MIELVALTTEKDVQSSFNKVRKAIDERECQIINDLEKIASVKKKELSIQIDDLKFTLESMNGCNTLSKNVLLKGNSFEILAMQRQLVSRLTYLKNLSINTQPITNTSIDYTPSHERSLMNSILSFGLVSSSNISTEMTFVEQIEKSNFLNEVCSFKVHFLTENSMKVERGSSLTVEVNGPSKILVSFPFLFFSVSIFSFSFFFFF